MILRNKSVIAGMAFVAVGAVLGAWITAETGKFSLGVPVAAQAQTVSGAVSLKDGFGPVVKKVAPAVVSITSTRVIRQSDRQLKGQDEELFRRFFGDDFFGRFGNPAPRGDQRRQGLGSGVITTRDGYILTNNHVVEGADEVKVILQDKREFTAKIIGTDPLSDVAVLKIDATDLPTAPLGNSSNVEVGDIVLAMGNPFGVGQTVTMGIVGATSRRGMGIEDFEDFIQTDAAINPGNSGGALVNVNGEVIGINTAIITGGGGGFLGGGGANAGVGFAIPANMAKNAMEQIIDKGKVSRGWLGVVIQPVDADIAKQFNLPGNPRGALVGDVTTGSPADKGGLKRGDIIVKLDGKEFSDSGDLRLQIAALKPGSAAHFDVFRDGKEQTITVNLGERPSNEELSRNRGGEYREGDAKGTPRLGVRVEPLTPELRRQFELSAGTQGLVVTDVESGSAAAEGGLRQGDVIQEVNRKPVTDTAEFQRMVRQSSGSILLLVSREGSTHFVTVKPR